ncbi:hypothetical protein ATK74_0916 [Propionicimonas paludicola]|uniref:Protein ImuA n=1 Tax=Propionicimonas paludicola TaxID=185243 RepID=A0A2A9CS68_9ACTN|nr:hypothetical protein [Propionicimonas paludicola]PFG16379.1 hypothetical protein ATK74_0916 [Propionicimonas paludicola]
MKAAFAVPNSASPAELLASLRAQVANAEARVRQQPFGLDPVLADLLGETGLKPGAAYCLAPSGALLNVLLAGASAQGHWCGAVGIPTLSAEAAAAAGVNLERLVLVPDPGEQWLAATAALAEVIPVLALRPPGRVREADAARLAARLRDRGGVLLVAGDWPRAEARFRIGSRSWQGLGLGHGHLRSQEVQVSVTSKRYPSGRSARVLLPASDGTLRAIEAPSPLRAVG